MEVTVFRPWVFNGRYQITIFDGTTMQPARHLLGNNGLLKLREGSRMLERFPALVQKGFPHHVCVVEGNWIDRLQVLATSLGVEIV